MFHECNSYEEFQVRMVGLFADPGEEEQAMLKAREEFYRKRLAERPKPKPRKKKEKPTRYIRFSQMPECEYTRERRIFTPPTVRPSRDALHRSWDGYEWAII